MSSSSQLTISWSARWTPRQSRPRCRCRSPSRICRRSGTPRRRWRTRTMSRCSDWGQNLTILRNIFFYRIWCIIIYFRNIDMTSVLRTSSKAGNSREDSFWKYNEEESSENHFVWHTWSLRAQWGLFILRMLQSSLVQKIAPVTVGCCQPFVKLDNSNGVMEKLKWFHNSLLHNVRPL